MATFLLHYADFTTANNGNSINNNHNNNFKKAMITAIFTGHLLCSKPQSPYYVASPKIAILFILHRSVLKLIVIILISQGRN